MWTLEAITKLGNWLRGTAFAFDPDAAANLNPDAIRIEDVAAVLRVSMRRARSICETAVRQGTFDRVGDVYRLNREGALSTFV